MIYVSQTIMFIMFHTLNIYSAVCQLDLTKLEEKEKEREHIMLDFTFFSDSEH